MGGSLQRPDFRSAFTFRGSVRTEQGDHEEWIPVQIFGWVPFFFFFSEGLRFKKSFRNGEVSYFQSEFQFEQVGLHLK